MRPNVSPEEIAYRLVDFVFARWPQRMPSRQALLDCRIVAHRGAHDNHRRLENTLPAFDRALETGLWGIELDVRWTLDLQPVVFHDADLKRIFHTPVRLADLSFSRVKKEYPLIPSLTDVVARYGQRLHLMIEIKEETYPDPAYQNRVLAESLAPLKPIEDFHFLALDPKAFDPLDCAVPAVGLLVARTDIRRLSQEVLRKNYGGLLGHYLLMTRALRRKHRRHGQRIGTGYPNSTNCLRREINRGTDWIFTNDAGRLETLRQKMLARTA